MSVYNIVRWDALLDTCSIQPKPFIYLKPDTEFIEFARRNRWRIRVKIMGTDSLYYDNRIYWSTVDRSTFAGGCRPNFFDETDLWIVTLDVVWNGYPNKLGKFKLITGPITPTLSPLNIQKLEDEVVEKYRNVPKLEPYREIKKKQLEGYRENLHTGTNSYGMNKWQIIGIILSVVIAIIIVFLVGILMKKKK